MPLDPQISLIENKPKHGALEFQFPDVKEDVKIDLPAFLQDTHG